MHLLFSKGGKNIPKKLSKLEQAKKRVKEISELYYQGLSIYKISEVTGINRQYIVKTLDEAGIRKFKDKKATDKEKENLITKYKKAIIDAYNSGESINKINKFLKQQGVIIGPRVIKKILKNEGVRIKTAKNYNTKYKANESSFAEYNKYSCYWAGLLAADGCIYKRKDSGNKYVILELIDRESVYGLKNYLEYTGKVNKYIKTTNSKKESVVWDMRCNSNKICQNLKENFNITENKTLIYTPPNTIPKDLIKYFILGYIDGDGSISYYTTSTGRKHFSLNVTGTNEMISYITDYFNLGHIKLFKRHLDRDNNNISLNVQGNDQLYKILSELYSDKDINKICMKRKYSRFKLLKEQKECKEASA